MLASALASGKYDKGVAGAWHGLLESAGSQLIGKRNPYCHFERYFGNELQSTTFIFAGNRLDKRDPTYNLDSISAELAPYLDKTEIALHNGIGTWDKEDILRANRNKIADRFGKAVAGIRPHYLDCKLPEFWSHLTEFEYSSSLGSDLRPGFVAGINTPLFGFTLPGWKQLDIIELPISLMDCALLAISDKQKRYRFVDDIIATCVSNHGILVLDWHNTSAYDNDFPGWFETYEYLINAALQNNAYIGGLGDIAKIWRTHCESVFSY